MTYKVTDADGVIIHVSMHKKDCDDCVRYTSGLGLRVSEASPEPQPEPAQTNRVFRVKIRGGVQEEVIRELKERMDNGAFVNTEDENPDLFRVEGKDLIVPEANRDALYKEMVHVSNVYDHQISERVGEGADAEGRKSLRALIRAIDGISSKLLKAEPEDNFETMPESEFEPESTDTKDDEPKAPDLELEPNPAWLV